MEIVIWGTKARGRRAMAVCNKTGRKIKAFTDNNPVNWGKTIDNIPIMSPQELTKEFMKNSQIWIATEAEEVYEQTKKISDNIIEWQLLKPMLLGDRYPYESVSLKSKNILHCQLVEDRNAFLKCFSNESENWKMAEIGVFRGDFSEQILRLCNPKKLFLIDLWADGYESNYLLVKEKFKSESEQGLVEILKGLSIERLKEFEDDELDWAYIDTVHDYDTTKSELELCNKKVKNGGYICGHDYAKMNVYARVDCGVYDAVNEFVVKHDYEFIYMTVESNGLQSFCLRKI